MEMKNWLQQRAYITPERLALTFEEHTWTYEQLNREAERMARKLTTLGIESGDHVGFLMENHPQTVFLIHALHYLKVVIVPLNKRLSPSELDYQLEDADVDWLIVDTQHESKAEDLTFNSVITMTKLSKQEQVDMKFDGSTINLEDLHTIIFTSGTTGHPKGVQLTYGNHWWSATGSALNLGIHEEDRWLCAVPLFHVSGLSILMRSVIYGMTMVLHQQFEADRFIRSVHEDKVSIASVVSVMLSNILDSDEFESFPATFRCMLLGGGPAPYPLLKRCEKTGIPVFQTYGLSESASQIVTLSPEDSMRKLGSAGKPLFPSQIKIKSSEADSPSPAGEILIKGPNVTQGYYKKEKENAEKIKDGWLATGDVGYLDEEGFLYVLDRRKDMFISGGENVYPAEIEACLLGHEAVSEAGVIGIAHEKWGKVPAAFVVIKKGKSVTEDDLIAYCTTRLAGYKVPKKVSFIDDLPRNASNKLLRRELYRYLEDGDDVEG
ncbi:o-succinylbenzoate--CoA ligase [Pseudalkalibacillus sp. SCS-8]|uniref:o-succinylbenzoate--CoA ligase n=1 Tax=Pseudalkalibacillus nanhaiensis TaxID=3115291 RepID=UPI0032DB525A